MPDLAEQLEQIEEVDEKDESQQMPTTVDKNKLTPQEVKDLEDGKTSIPKLTRERNQLAQSAKVEMHGLLRTDKSKEVIDLGEYKDLKQELADLEREIAATHSPEKMKELLDRLRDIPRRRQQEKLNQQKQAESEKERLDENDPRLKELKEQFSKICRDNEHLIGGGDVKGYIKWFENELRKNPTVAHGKEIIDRLEGKRVYDKDGLAPRREVYNELEQAFKKHGIDSPLKSKFIKQEGLRERKEFLQGIKNAETEIKRVNDSFWSPKAKRKAMQEILMAKNPHEQKEFTAQINKINNIESEGFIYMKNTMSVGGTTVRKMSDASIDAFLSGLTNEGSIKKRLDYITGNGKYSNGIKEAVENEASLYGKEVKPEVAKLFGITKGLEEIYKDNPDLLKLAIKSFEKLDFMKKISALKEHERLVAKEKDKNELEKKLTLRAAEVAIDEAARKGIMSKGDAKEDKEWFADKNKHKNPTTGKPGDLETLKKHYEILVSSTPDAKAKNISAYSIKRERFREEAKKLHIKNKAFTKTELQKWQDKYDSKGWSDRKKVYKDFVATKEKLDKEQEKQKALERAAGIEESNEKESKENLTQAEAIRAAIALINDDQPAEAIDILNQFIKEQREKDPNKPVDPKVTFWMSVAIQHMEKFGAGKALDKETDKKLDTEIKDIAKSDSKIKDRIEEENLTTLNVEAARQSEDRHEKKISGQDRAKKESMGRAQGELERDLTEDFYEQTDDRHQLNKEGTGEQREEIKFDGVDMTDQEREKLKDQTRKHETQIFEKTGFTHIDLKDKTGKKISAEQAESEQAARLEQLENELAEKAMKKTAKKEGKSPESGATIYDLNTRIAAKRKARELLEKERHSHERLRNAA